MFVNNIWLIKMIPGFDRHQISKIAQIRDSTQHQRERLH